MNRRAFLSMIGLAAPTYFFAPRGGLWLPPEPRIASYADYLSVSDLMLERYVSYDVRFFASLLGADAFPLMPLSRPLPQRSV